MKSMKVYPFGWARLVLSGVLNGVLGVSVIGMPWLSSFDAVAQEVLPPKTEKSENQNDDNRILVIDRDGRKLNATLVPGMLPQVERPANPANLRGMINGPIKVKDKEGKELEIIPQSIMVSQSVRRSIVDGEEKVEQVQNTIVTDADGNQYQFEMPVLPGTVRDFVVGDMPPSAMAMVLPATTSKYYLGVVTEAVPATLVERTNLDSGTGLIVRQVMSDSPAAQAGLKADDILLYAEDKPLAQTDHLVESIQQAGEGERKLALIVVRDDEEMTITVMPQQRPADAGFPLLSDEMLEQLGMDVELPPAIRERLQERPGFQFRFERALPGMILGDEMMLQAEMLEGLDEHFKKMEQHFEGVDERLERVRGMLEKNRELEAQRRQATEDGAGRNRNQQQMQQLMRAMQQGGRFPAFPAKPNNKPDSKPSSDQQIELLQQQIEALKKELETLKSQRENNN